MHLHADLDGGNIEVLSVTESSARLAVRADSRADEFRQWFFFAVENHDGGRIDYELANAGDTTYPDAWNGYHVCASYDRDEWFRVPTEFDGTSLRWSFEASAPVVHFAYFAPYDLERHARIVEAVASSDRGRVEVLGETTQGRTMDLCVVGPKCGEPKFTIWVTARQHPGETMAEWFAEGLLMRLVGAEPDALVDELLERAVVYVVPNMNPDGSALGNLRTNAVGTNLNRAWLAPDDETSPEVLCVRAKMEETGVDLFLDVHGDERNPYCFLAGCEGNPGYSERLRHLENLFEQSLCAFDPDFQDVYGYDRDEPGGGDLRTAGNWVGERFDCLSYTLEMPFKDADNHPDPTVGWSPDRARRLGASCLASILVCLDSLRGPIEGLDDEAGESDEDESDEDESDGDESDGDESDGDESDGDESDEDESEDEASEGPR